ncbi:MAG TPA: hypothetical protein VF958_12455, partial [Thermoanaerobaculia bacterium]
MNAIAPIVCALLLFGPPAAPVSRIASPESERQADLARLRSRIQSLQGQLEDSRRRQATLSEELARLELQLEIAAQEKELLARLREDYAVRLEEIAAERRSAEEAASRSRRDLLARARLLQRFGRFGYVRVLLEARDVPAFLESVSRLDSLARRDARLLTEHREAQRRLESGLERERALKTETDRLYAESRREESRIASLKTERENLLERQRAVSASQRLEVAALSDKA